MIFQILDWSYCHDDTTDKKLYVIRLFGRTNDNKTIYVMIYDFCPYFYVEIPIEWKPSKVKILIDGVKKKVQEDVQEGFKEFEIIESCKFYGFTNYEKFKFAKLIFNDFESMKKYSFVLQQKIYIPEISKTSIKFNLYESNIEPFLRCMHIRNLDAVGWVKIDNFEPITRKQDLSFCDINIRSTWDCLEVVNDKTISKFVIAVFDIECTSEDGSFPQANRDNDKVIQIGTTFQRFGEDECFKKHIIVLGSCDKFEDDVDVESCKTEEDVLLAWSKLIRTENPDIISGYYIFGFDYLYLMNRSKKLGIFERFSRLSRIRNEVSLFKADQKLSSSALGDNSLNYYEMTGRVQFDLMKVIQRDYKLDYYKLDFVSSWFIREVIKNIEIKNDTSILFTGNTYGLRLNQYIGIYYNDGITDYKYLEGEKFKVIELEKEKIVISKKIDTNILKLGKVFWTQVKDDIKPSDIFRLNEGTSKDRALIAKYCVQDCVLCNKLIVKLQVIPNNVGMANVCNVPLSYLYLRGQGVKIFSLVAKECRLYNHLIPLIKKKKKDDSKKYSESDEEDEGYEGAIVFEPKPGVYYEPIPVLDYSSLYPRSMIERNLSHETIVINKKYDYLPDYNYHEISYKLNNGEIKNCRFAQKKDGSYGIIPQILIKLLDARTQTKSEMDNEKDPFKKKVLNGLQLAYKITANSLYGQTGAGTSPIYMKDIAASTTAIGRERLQFSKEFIETIYGKMVNLALMSHKKYLQFCDKTFSKTPKKKFNKPKNGWTTDIEYYEFFYKIMNELLKGKTIEPKVIYGDTDSVFFTPHIMDENGKVQTDKESLKTAIQLGIYASHTICLLLPEPQEQAYEKTMYPFMILTKKRYVGNLYEKNPDKFEQKSMGIVLKRRDNAPIVKIVCAGIIDEILNKRNPKGAIIYTKKNLIDIVKGNFPIDKFVITKTLREGYKDRTRIAHAILADRMTKRDQGNKPLPNDRIPYVYVEVNKKTKLQGERIEHVDYVINNKLKIDYLFYITNQIMKPALQFLELIAKKPNIIFDNIIKQEENKKKHIRPISHYIDIEIKKKEKKN